tara:strand:+ start:111 stop:302 length:192 start_codon:yes stop_codon:yes gene_type:complete
VVKLRPGEPRDSIRLRLVKLMGKHYDLFTDRIEAVAPECFSEEITAELEEKLTSLLGTPITVG